MYEFFRHRHLKNKWTGNNKVKIIRIDKSDNVNALSSMAELYKSADDDTNTDKVETGKC